MKTVDMNSKEGRMIALLNNATHMRPAQISDAKSTSNE